MLNKISKKVIDEIRSLHMNKVRKERKLFIAEGPRIVHELLNSGLKIRLVAALADVAEDLERQFPEVNFYSAGEKDLERITAMTTPNKIIAVASMPATEFSVEETLRENMIVLDGISDPGNLGTIIRTAEWFGVNTIWCSGDSVDCWNPKVVQATMGSLFRVRVGYGNILEITGKIITKGSHLVVGASMDGTPLHQLEFRQPFLLVIGGESHGIRKELAELLPLNVTISGRPGQLADSLNASVACGIILYKLTHNKKPG